MDNLLAVAGKLAQFDPELIGLLRELYEQLGKDRQATIDALRNYLLDPQATSAVGKLLKLLGADQARVKAALEKHHQQLVLLLGNVADLPAAGLALPLKVSVAPAGGGWGIKADASLIGKLVPDGDGTLLEGALTFEAGRDTYVEWAVNGALTGAVSGGIKTGTVGANGAFNGSGEILFSNFFLHDPTETALGALSGDVGRIKLPGQIERAEDLLPAAKRGDRELPQQVVRVRAAGMVAIGGSLNISTSYLGSFSVTSKALTLDRVIPVQAKLTAEASFSYALDGVYDLLVQRSPDRPAMVRVRLAKSQTKSLQAGVKIGVNASIKGLDGVAKALLDRFVPQLDALAARLDETQQQFPELRALFESRTQAEVDKLLAKQETTKAIEAWLRQVVNKDLDLKAKLKQLLVDAAVKNAGDALDKIDTKIAAAREAIVALVGKYQAARAKLDKAVQRLADAKLSLTFERRRERLAKKDVLIEIDVDPSSARDLYRQALAGDLAPLLLAARTRSDVVLHNGELFESGHASVQTDFSFNAFGFGTSTGSILAQDWETHVSASGELTISVKSSYEAYTKHWGARHSLALLIDSKVLGILGQSGTVEAVQLGTSASLTLRDDVKARTKDVAELEERLRSVGVRITKGTLFSSLQLPPTLTSDAKIASEALIMLDTAALRALTDAPTDATRRVMAEALLTAFQPEPPVNVRDDNGLPVFIWPQALGWPEDDRNNRLETKWVGHAIESAGKRITLDKFAVIRIAYFAIVTELFLDFLAQLRDLRNNSVASGTPEAIEGRIIEAHRIASRKLSRAVAIPGGGRDHLNQAVFHAVNQLTRAAIGEGPVAAITTPDDRLVVVGDGAHIA